MPFDPIPERKLTTYGKLFLDAANEIRKHGLAKGTLQNYDKAMCMMGAMFKANHGDAQYVGGNHQAWSIALGFTNSNAVCSWNNTPERTAEEVIARFEQHAYA